MSGTFSEGNELKEVVTFSNGSYFSVFKFVEVEYKEFGGFFFSFWCPKNIFMSFILKENQLHSHLPFFLSFSFPPWSLPGK